MENSILFFNPSLIFISIKTNISNQIINKMKFRTWIQLWYLISHKWAGIELLELDNFLSPHLGPRPQSPQFSSTSSYQI